MVLWSIELNSGRFFFKVKNNHFSDLGDCAGVVAVLEVEECGSIVVSV